MTAVLGIFAKWPAPGRVKTRLGVSPRRAVEVALAFLRDTMVRLHDVADQRHLVFAPAEARDDVADFADPAYDLTPQTEGDLGQRLEHFFRDRFAAGASKVVVVGTDSPTLPVAHVADAFRQLDEADVVLGPATDGGYYLIGCRRLPPIFTGIAWSGPQVLAQTVAQLPDPSWTLALLPPWYDVDTPESWAMLVGHIAAMRRAGVDPGMFATEKLLHDPAVDHRPLGR